MNDLIKEIEKSLENTKSLYEQVYENTLVKSYYHGIIVAYEGILKSLEDKNTTSASSIECLEVLEKENIRLNIILDDTKSDYLKTLRENADLQLENKKLKKAIETLKSVIILPMENDISMVDNKGNNYYKLRYIKRLLNEQEYDLLKEVLDK